MTDREKVIKGLETCVEDTDRRWKCKRCPYQTAGGSPCETIDPLMDDALALLKAQEPRVMTLEEVYEIYNSNKAHIWPHDTPPYLWMENANKRNIVCYWISWSHVVDCIEGRYPRYDPDDYGVEWRIWTSRPTDAQREAIPWEG